MRKNILLYSFFGLLMVLLVAFDLLHGMDISALFRGDESSLLDRMILVDLRAPRVLTALLAGTALSVSGLMMQTLFRNPLAGPYTLGVSSGASLGVALVVMAGLNGGIIAAGVAGSIVLLLLVIAIAQRLRSNTAVLIVGLMLGSVASAIVNLIQNFANPDALKLFITWTFGSLSATEWSDLAVLTPTIVVGLLLAIALIKPMNSLALGENYALALGVPVDRIRQLIVITTGILAGAVTAYCGPIAFIGVAVPHIARCLVATNNHRQVMPMTLLVGGTLLIICDILSTIGTTPLPISTVSALFGAPVIIWIICRK